MLDIWLNQHQKIWGPQTKISAEKHCNNSMKIPVIMKLVFFSVSIIVRKWRGTKQPLDEVERGEWKIGLNTQHSKNEDRGK